MEKFREKTVLITGASGMIGSHVAEALIKEGADIVALGRSKEKLSDIYAKHIIDGRVKIIAQDISEPIKCDTNVDYIFHAASPMEGKVISNRPLDVIIPNTFGTINCLEFMREQEKRCERKGRFILFSSVTVYGNITDNDISVAESETNITDVLDSNSACYSQSKRLSEVIVSAYQKQYGINAVIARLSTVYGDAYFKPDTAFFEFLKKACAGENITVNNSCLPRRDNIYIDDAVNGLLLIAEKGICGEAYNISSNGELGNFASVDEIAEIITDISNKYSGTAIKVLFRSENKSLRKPGIKLDNTKLKQLGWVLKTNLVNGIAKSMGFQ